MDDFQNGDNFQQASDNHSGGGSDTGSDFSIPEEYKDRGWTKVFDGKTGDDLKAEFFRSYDNSQTLIGKKVEDYFANTDLKSLENYDQIKEQLTKQIAPEFQTPEDIKDYGLKDILTEAEVRLPIDDSALDSFAEKFKELGVNKEQGQAILKEYVELTMQDFEKVTNAEELESSINQMFNGNQEQRKNVEALIRESLSDEEKQMIQDFVPNVVIEMFYKVTKNLVDKYDFKEGTSNSNNPAKMRMSDADRNAEYDRLYQQLLDLDSRPHQVGEKEKIVKRMQEIFK